MRGDWHRYNLKRRVASLPPLSSEVFAEKVLTAQATSTAAAAKASFEKQCAACQKTYYSENAYQNHLGSQKHRLRLAALRNGDPSKDTETESVISSAISLGEPINQTPTETIDPEAEAEFSKVIDGIKEAKLDDQDAISRRPSRPHHSANEERSEHPLSENPTTESTPTVSRPRSPTQAALVFGTLALPYLWELDRRQSLHILLELAFGIQPTFQGPQIQEPAVLIIKAHLFPPTHLLLRAATSPPRAVRSLPPVATLLPQLYTPLALRVVSPVLYPAQASPIPSTMGHPRQQRLLLKGLSTRPRLSQSLTARQRSPAVQCTPRLLLTQ